MPRGVYDRSKSKTKKQDAAPAAPTEKKARAPWGSKKATKTAAAPSAPTPTTSYGWSVMELASLRGAFTGNNPNNGIVTKIDTLISKQLDEAIMAASPAEKPETAAGEAKKVVQAPAPVQVPAPVQAVAPFNPAVPPNGQA